MDQWYEYDCPECGIDYDIEAVPKIGHVIKCACGAEIQVTTDIGNAYIKQGGDVECIALEVA